jgi:hypothetical protein
MSTFDQTKDQAAKKAEETKGLGQEKAGQAQGAAKVCSKILVSWW